MPQQFYRDRLHLQAYNELAWFQSTVLQYLFDAASRKPDNRPEHGNRMAHY